MPLKKNLDDNFYSDEEGNGEYATDRKVSETEEGSESYIRLLSSLNHAHRGDYYRNLVIGRGSFQLLEMLRKLRLSLPSLIWAPILVEEGGVLTPVARILKMPQVVSTSFSLSHTHIYTYSLSLSLSSSLKPHLYCPCHHTPTRGGSGAGIMETPLVVFTLVSVLLSRFRFKDKHPSPLAMILNDVSSIP